MRILGCSLLGIALLSGCAGGPFQSTGQYRVDVGADGSVSVESATIRGGPSVEIETRTDGSHTTRIQHDDTLEILPDLLRLLRPI